MKKTTNEIENELKHVKTQAELKQFMEENLSGQLRFGDRLLELCKQHGVKHADLLNTVAVSKSQLYAVINGTRNPSKELYVKNRADSIIIYGLRENKTLFEIEELLKEYQVEFSLTDEE